MATNVTLNGTSYAIPATGDDDWGDQVSAYLIALASGVLQKAGGSFTLTAEVDFGADYGVKALYTKSRGSNPSTAGVARYANAEYIGWRNAANSANLLLGVNASNQLEFNSLPISALALGTANQVLGVNSGATGQEYKTISGTANQITVTHGANSIALSAPQNIHSAATPTFAGMTLTAFSGVVKATAGVLSAATLVNADVDAAAAIARTKLASGTASHVLINDGSGVMTSEASLAISRGGTGQATAAAGFNALSPVTTKGDLIAGSGVNTTARLAVGSDGTVLSADSAEATGLKWVSPLTNPMSAVGDLIRGGASGAATRLAGNTTTTKKFLTQTGDGSASAAPAWETIVAADLKVDTDTSPTFTGFGTPTNVQSTMTLIGNVLFGMIRFTVGTPTATQARVSLPNTLARYTNPAVVGRWTSNSSSASSVKAGPVLATAGNAYINIGGPDDFNTGYDPLAAVNGNEVIAAGSVVSLYFTVFVTP